jgi:hypothetical protein
MNPALAPKARIAWWDRLISQRCVYGRGKDRGGLAEINRHALSVPCSPRILDEHYPGHPGGNGPRQPRPRTPGRRRSW